MKNPQKFDPHQKVFDPRQKKSWPTPKMFAQRQKIFDPRTCEDMPPTLPTLLALAHHPRFLADLMNFTNPKHHA